MHVASTDWSSVISRSALALVMALAPRVAGATTPDPAESLFTEGVALMDAGNPEQGCPPIERSLQLDPRPGTLFTLAECEAQRGRLARALARYDEYLAIYAALPAEAKIRQRERERTALAQKAALTRRAPTLKIVLPPRLPPGMVIERDDEVFPESQGGRALAVDPGKHLIAASGPGMEPWRQVLIVPEGATIVVIVPALEARRPDAVPAARAEVPPAEAPPGEGGSTRRVIAGVTGGVGVAAVVTGVALGLSARSAWNSVLAHCNPPGSQRGCRPADASVFDKAGALADGSTATFVIGGAAIVTAGVLLLTAPSAKKAPAAWRFTPVVGRAAAAGVLEGSF